MKRSTPLFATLIVLLLLLAACGETPTPEPPTPKPPTATTIPATDTPVAAVETPTPAPADAANIVERVATMDDLSTLSQAIVNADLVDKLSSDGPYTLFAPTNAAFETLDSEVADDADLLFDLLLYHVIDGELTAADAAALETATSLLGDELDFSMEGDTLLVNGASIVTDDIIASNGIIHVIDTALIPPTLGTE